MQIRRAYTTDVPAINELMGVYGLLPITNEYFNSRDIALIARDEDGKVCAFIWCGLMAKNKLGYIEYFTVHPDYALKGLGETISYKLVEVSQKLGVSTLIGLIKQDMWHDKSISSAIKSGMMSDSVPHSLVIGKVDSMKSKGDTQWVR